MTLADMVLHKLVQRPRSGYGLCKSIEECTGKKPSFGSIYPILEKLTNDGHVTVEEQGRKKIYTLTKKGNEAAKDIASKHQELLKNAIVNIRTTFEMMGQDPSPMIAAMERAQKGEPLLGPITANMIKFRDTMFTMAQDGRAKKYKKELNAMLKEMLKKVAKLT
ncbi:MAG: PadR family transcriptional regulator [Candidatus Woesearchaeota archaeon]|nr:PadR family transcriptional regulator [Candidatus Woesearchaeota archaeon]